MKNPTPAQKANESDDLAHYLDLIVIIDSSNKQQNADRISGLKGHFKSPKCKVLSQSDVKDTHHELHANCVLVPADKAANNIIVVCNRYHIDTLVKELEINNVNSDKPTYIPLDDSFKTIVKTQNYFITSMGWDV